VNSLDFQGEIILANFSLLPISRYLQDTLPFQLDTGHINLTFNYDIGLSQQEPNIRVDSIELSMNEPALQTQAVDSNIEVLLEAQPKREESLTTRRLAVLESLYIESAMQTTLDQIRRVNTPAPDVTSDSPTAEVQPSAPWPLDTLAYIADLRDRLITAEDINEGEFAALGPAQRDAVVAFLSISGGISASLLIGVDAVVSDEDDEGWLALPFGLTAQ